MGISDLDSTNLCHVIEQKLAKIAAEEARHNWQEEQAKLEREERRAAKELAEQKRLASRRRHDRGRSRR